MSECSLEAISHAKWCCSIRSRGTTRPRHSRSPRLVALGSRHFPDSGRITIEDNLTFGLLRTVTYEELEEAARNANILDYIRSQPLGFKTALHERGQSLSGEQRQRAHVPRPAQDLDHG